MGWEAESGAKKQEFEFHTAPTLSVAWRDDNVFATCSSDKSIYLCQVERDTPLIRFYGHHDEINCVEFDPSGRFLASGSDDHSAKIWTSSSETCVLDLNAHTEEVFSVAWSPVGSGGDGPQLLATASQDMSIKLWD